ncbi:MAG TPA: hypothetical protein VK638_12575 [Edaphobacter sp.]|jgi:hypothetical protein|nr:hypothetical protein [Edaphobacter sp.]
MSALLSMKPIALENTLPAARWFLLRSVAESYRSVGAVPLFGLVPPDAARRCDLLVVGV